MNFVVSVRPGDGSPQPRWSVAVAEGDERSHSLQFAWQRAALLLYNKQLRSGERWAYGVYIVSFSGSRPPLGAWHVHFKREGGMSDLYIVEIGKEDG